MARLGHDIAALIALRHPGALKGDADQLAIVAKDIAITFGGLIAMSLRLNGEDHTAAVIKTIVNAMLDQAGIVDNKALEIIMRERRERHN